MRNKLYRFVILTLIFSIVITVPVFAADNKEGKKVSIEYEDINDHVRKKNAQIKLNNLSIGDMKDALDSANDSSGGMRDMQNSIYEISSMLNGIISTSDDPEIVALAQATLMNLQLSGGSMDMGGGADTDGMRDQIRTAELGYEHAEKSIVNSAQNIFVVYHQLSENISSMDRSREMMTNQLEIAEHSLNYGLVSPSTIADLKSKIREFDVNYNNLVNQRDALVLQFKGLIGLKYEDEVVFGDVPKSDRNYISKIDFDKDLKSALKSSMSIKTKKSELSSKSADSKTKEYELQLKENEITANLKKQYQLLNEKLDTLKLSESSLIAAEARLFKAEVSYHMGMISKSDFNSAKNEVESQKSTVKSNEMALFIEIENYKSMVKGMI